MSEWRESFLDCTTPVTSPMEKENGNQTPGSFPALLRERVGAETSRNRERKPFLTLWPNGQFSLAYKYVTTDDCVKEGDEWKWIKRYGYEPPKGGVPPNLVSTQQSSQTEHGYGGRQMKKYGLKGITRHGQKMVRSGACLLQRKFGRRGLCFLTLTVPTLSQSDRAKVAMAWGDLMRQVVQRLTRELVRAGQPKLVVSVTELQSARAERYSQAYLHAHIVYPARRRASKHWVVDASDFRSWWKKRIESKIGHPLANLPRVELKTIRKSAEGYLGKYMTKGAGDMQAIVDDLGEDAVPGQQWNMSGDLREIVKSTTVKSFMWGEYVQALLDAMVDGWIELKGYWRRVEIDLGGRTVTTAWVGALSDELRREYEMPWVDVGATIIVNDDLKRAVAPVEQWRMRKTCWI